VGGRVEGVGHVHKERARVTQSAGFGTSQAQEGGHQLACRRREKISSDRQGGENHPTSCDRANPLKRLAPTGERNRRACFVGEALKCRVWDDQTAAGALSDMDHGKSIFLEVVQQREKIQTNNSNRGENIYRGREVQGTGHSVLIRSDSTSHLPF